MADIAGDRAKWIAALIEAASIRRRIRVSGNAFQTSDHDVMITITVARRKVVAETHTFRNGDTGKTPDVLLRELVPGARVVDPFRGHPRQWSGELLGISELTTGGAGRASAGGSGATSTERSTMRTPDISRRSGMIPITGGR